MSQRHVLVLGRMGMPEDIVSAAFHRQDKSLRVLSTRCVGLSTDHVEPHPTLAGLIYVATRSNGIGKVTLAAVALDGHVTLLDSAETGLNDPCDIKVLPDLSGLVIAHFLGSGVTFIPLHADGSFKQRAPSHMFMPEYKPSDHPRQNAPHPHQVVFCDDEILIPDQGSNCVWRLHFAVDKGFQLLQCLDDFVPGEGPRRLVPHPNGKLLYVLGEMSSDVSIHTSPRTSVKSSTCIARHSIIPRGSISSVMLAAELILKDNFLICSNRGSPLPDRDAVTIFPVKSDGSLGAPRFVYFGLSHIRTITQSADGLFCLAGRDFGGVVICDNKWKELARLDVSDVACPVWMT